VKVANILLSANAKQAIANLVKCAYKRFQQTHQNIGIEPIERGDGEAEDKTFIPQD
jgi:hypothetical protein